MFESELILRPIRVDDETIDVEPLNEIFHDRGLPASHVVFHEGYVITAWDQDASKIRTYNPRDLVEGDSYPSLEEWYCRCIRTEYAKRYGLASLESDK